MYDARFSFLVHLYLLWFRTSWFTSLHGVLVSVGSLPNVGFSYCHGSGGHEMFLRLFFDLITSLISFSTRSQVMVFLLIFLTFTLLIFVAFERS